MSQTCPIPHLGFGSCGQNVGRLYSNLGAISSVYHLRSIRSRFDQLVLGTPRTPQHDLIPVADFAVEVKGRETNSW